MSAVQRSLVSTSISLPIKHSLLSQATSPFGAKGVVSQPPMGDSGFVPPPLPPTLEEVYQTWVKKGPSWLTEVLEKNRENILSGNTLKMRTDEIINASGAAAYAAPNTRPLESDAISLFGCTVLRALQAVENKKGAEQEARIAAEKKAAEQRALEEKKAASDRERTEKKAASDRFLAEKRQKKQDLICLTYGLCTPEAGAVLAHISPQLRGEKNTLLAMQVLNRLAEDNRIRTEDMIVLMKEIA